MSIKYCSIEQKGGAFYTKTFFPNAAAYLRHETVEDLHSKKPEVAEVIPGVKVVGGNAKLILAQAFLTVVSIPQKSKRKLIHKWKTLRQYL